MKNGIEMVGIHPKLHCILSITDYENTLYYSRCYFRYFKQQLTKYQQSPIILLTWKKWLFLLFPDFQIFKFKYIFYIFF